MNRIESMPTLAAEVVQLIQDIKGAVQNLNDSADSNVAIVSYRLGLKTTFEASATSRVLASCLG
jgi:hypothetical protein